MFWLLLLLFCCQWVLQPAAGTAQQPVRASLQLHVTAEGKPTVARVYITDENGRPYLVPGTITYSRRGEVHSIVNENATIALFPGKYKVRAEKGAEFESAERVANLAADKLTRLELKISRFYNMNEHGWYCGDLHIHRSPDEMPLLARAEELNVSPTITWHVGDGRQPKPSFPKTNLLPGDGTHIVSVQNQEVERLRKGHGAVVVLNTPEQIEPNISILFPLDVEFCRRARKQGGFVDAEKPIWKNVPLNMAFGVIDSIGVVNNHFHPYAVLLDAEEYGSMERDKPVYNTVAGFAQWMMDLYYSFLNCGFRVPVSAGSASGVMPTWPGYERVYVHLSGPFTYEQWFHDLKAGRSVATNGPLLQVYVDGKPPGTELAWQKSTHATLAIDVRSRAPLDSVEVVFNGGLVRVFNNVGKTIFKSSLTLPIAEPGWLAVRCFEPVSATLRYAHSSPFYFLQNGKLPVRKSDAQRWADYIHHLAVSINVADFPSREDYERVQTTLKEAESIYRRLANGARTFAQRTQRAVAHPVRKSAPRRNIGRRSCTYASPKAHLGANWLSRAGGIRRPTFCAARNMYLACTWKLRPRRHCQVNFVQSMGYRRSIEPQILEPMFQRQRLNGRVNPRKSS